ncbi:unnamed protein product [Closterium sp. Naga37s-1]|nr:unnamed protein product [Closterium sp. Naga37s-1]
MAALLLRNLSSARVRVSSSRNASRLSSKQNNQPIFLSRGAGSARRPLNNALVRQQNWRAGRRSQGLPDHGKWVAAGSHRSWTIEDGIGPEKNYYPELVKASTGMDEFLAALSLAKEYDTRSTHCNSEPVSATDGSSSPSLPQQAPNQKSVEEVSGACW